MKGLLIKDICLMKEQKTLLIFLLVSIVFMLNVTGNGPEFIVNYTSMIFALLVLSTISYDDFNNGMSYILTLPATRSQYVLEKYIFSIISTLIGWTISVVISTLYILDKMPEKDIVDWLITCAACIIIYVFLLSLMIPINLKFGNEKGRLFVIVIMAFVGGAVLLLYKLSKKSNIDLSKIDKFIDSLSGTVIALITVAFAFLMLTISYIVSKRVVCNKEY